MIDKCKVLALYNESIDRVKIWSNPLVHIRDEVRQAIDYTGLDLNPRMVEICEMIDYYAGKADKIFSASILMPRARPASLLIEQTEIAPIVNHVLANYPRSIVDRATYPQRLRIDIWR